MYGRNNLKVVEGADGRKEKMRVRNERKCKKKEKRKKDIGN